MIFTSTYIITKDGELYHYGIKGMKWGIRRFQNEDGTYTSAGKKRRDIQEAKSIKKSSSNNSGASAKKKSSHRVLLENKYKKAGMSKKEAEAAADKRIKVEKAIAITAGVTVAAATAYYARNKYLADRCDQVLKAGTTFHNLDSAANPRPGEHLYVNYRQNDTDFFRGQFALGKMKRSETGNAFNHEVVAKNDIKIPSLKTRKDTFKELYDNDEQFRNAFNKNSRGPNAVNANQAYKKMWPRFGNKDNEDFNVAKRKYFDALGKKGYDAIVDEWDTNAGVYRSDAPLILLNTSSKSLGEMTIGELSARDVLLAQANSRHYAPSRNVKTALGIPHTNHFKESEQHISKYAKKSAENSKYLDKGLSALNRTYNTSDRKRALNKQGAVVVDTGKLLSKNRHMKVETAYKIARTKNDVVNTVYGLVTMSGATALYMSPRIVANRAFVEKYIHDHPNTKLTYNEIVKLRTER